MTTFEELCPVWNKAINQEGVKLFDSRKKYDECNFICDERIINIRNASHCVVGEAYGWNSDYMIMYDTRKSCVGCNTFAENFPFVDNMENLTKMKNDFVNHWDLDHKVLDK